MGTRCLAGLGVVFVIGCGLDTAGGGDDSPARELFVQRAWPALARCGGCHQAQPGIDFLAPGTADAAYETVFTYQPPVVDLEEPAASLLVTMGMHSGPALASGESAAVLEWLAAERDARAGDAEPPASIGPVILALGTANTIDLAPAGAPGATLRLVPDALGTSGLYVTRFELVAGATPLRLVHPLVISHPAPDDASPDLLDQFADVDVGIAPHTAYALGGGTAAFLGFAPRDPVTFEFGALDEVMP